MPKRADRKADLANVWPIITTAPWPFQPEHVFHPERKWRLDWACPRLRLAVEVEGITYFGGGIGRHQSAAGIEADMEKYNAAAALGWRVLRYSQRMIKRDPHTVVTQILEVAAMIGAEQDFTT
jgi:very-short-patch-repair endonuclease